MNIEDIEVGNGINLEAKVVSLEPAKEEYRHSVRTINRYGVIKDKTGSVLIVFHGLDALAVTVGMIVKLENGYACIYKDKLYVSTGKWGKTTFMNDGE
jgi:hypothetical protein